MKKTPKDKAPKIVRRIPVHEFSRDGSFHRVSLEDLLGQWFTYRQIAVLKTATSTYYAATDYYHGALPTNEVFVTQVVS
jgi:hypothetical protein